MTARPRYRPPAELVHVRSPVALVATLKTACGQFLRYHDWREWANRAEVDCPACLRIIAEREAVNASSTATERDPEP